MSKEVNNFDVLKQMGLDNNTTLKMANTIVESRSTKQGGIIGMGVDSQTFMDISMGNNQMVFLIVVDRNEFNKTKQVLSETEPPQS
jgi:hypothetical protein